MRAAHSNWWDLADCKDMNDHRSFVHVKIRAKKYSDLKAIRTHDLCDIEKLHYQLSYQANWELVT